MLCEAGREDLLKPGVPGEAWVDLERPKGKAEGGVTAAVLAYLPEGNKLKAKLSSKIKGKGLTLKEPGLRSLHVKHVKVAGCSPEENLACEAERVKQQLRSLFHTIKRRVLGGVARHKGKAHETEPGLLAGIASVMEEGVAQSNFEVFSSKKLVASLGNHIESTDSGVVSGACGEASS
ncbi:hypothetical protein NDU88_001935 [Pleurodeles waltl]|uniref:Uncharacterized protein n=1 Tax=Pleurodeles waltl TaxID=8319 RepID=A0AAV7UUQ9_PLEWA|nr:hypothetical protein NDU88_001935 [Pleurodeles waltl]